ncbi:MAG: hypothetical protein PVG39_07910 [Desulfobacteraceae bacterium]|jgi:hypothetical protein
MEVTRKLLINAIIGAGLNIKTGRKFEEEGLAEFTGNAWTERMVRDKAKAMLAELKSRLINDMADEVEDVIGKHIDIFKEHVKDLRG